MQVVILFSHLKFKYLECSSAHQQISSELWHYVAPKLLFEHAIDLFIFQLATNLLDDVELQTLFSVSADSLNISIVF